MLTSVTTFPFASRIAEFGGRWSSNPLMFGVVITCSWFTELFTRTTCAGPMAVSQTVYGSLLVTPFRRSTPVFHVICQSTFRFPIPASPEPLIGS